MPPPPDAIILAGGFGTRLRSVLPDLPKPLAPVLGRPFLLHLLDRLAVLGLRRAVLSLGYRADLVRTAVADYRRLSLSSVVEDRPLGTGGALRLALGETSGERLLGLNGDSFTPFDPASFEEFHRRGGFDVSLIGVEMNDASRFGLLRIDASGRVLAFQEKRAGAAGIVNAGIYLIERRVLETLPPARALSFEKDVLEPLAERGRLGALVAPGPFIDIGTPESYACANDFFSSL